MREASLILVVAIVMCLFVAGIWPAISQIPIVKHSRELETENATTTAARLRCTKIANGETLGYPTISTFDATSGDCYYAKLEKI